MALQKNRQEGIGFDWLNFLNDQFSISPVVLSMVCYPFISEKEYRDVRLDVVSSKDFTIFSDDLMSSSKLGQKISNAFVKKKPLNSTPFDESAMAMVRQYFEPSYKAKDEQIIEVADAYSVLKIFHSGLSDSETSDLVNSYFSGTKVIAFIKQEMICMQLLLNFQWFRKRGIIADKDDIRLANADELQKDFLCNNRSFRIFNFEIYVHDFELGADEVVVEGQYTNQQRSILEDIANSTN